MTPSLLVVEDETELADLYVAWLEDEYELRVVRTAEAALDAVSNWEFDALLLDRRLPDSSGAELLQTLRDQGYDRPVALVTAVPPDFDIIDMGFDNYIQKPVGREELVETVATTFEMGSSDDLQRQLTAKKITRTILRGEKPRPALATNNEFTALEQEIKTLEAKLQAGTTNGSSATDQTRDPAPSCRHRTNM